MDWNEKIEKREQMDQCDDTDKLMKKMLTFKNWAVVGANNDELKYGNKIYRKLKSKGYNVTPINPKYEKVDGDFAPNTLKDMDYVPDCVNVVVSPKYSMQTVKDAIDLGIKMMWFQPGAFDEEVLELAESNGIHIVFYDCILVEVDRFEGLENN